MSRIVKLIGGVIASFLISGSAIAQEEMAITFDEFEAVVRQLKIPGFSSIAEVSEEEGEYAEYQAYFFAGNNMFSLKMEPRKGGPVWGSTSYLLAGREAEYAVSGNLAILTIDLPPLESVLTLMSNKMKDKQQFEEIARNTGLLQKNYETVPWPDEIPAAYRPFCTVVGVEKYESETEGYTTDYVLTVLMDENLKASFRRLRSAYEDNGNYIAFPDATMLTQQHGELDGLEYCCQSGEKLTITYFIP